MSNFSRKAVAVGLALTTAAWLAGAVLPASAQTSATTIATLMAQIQALQAQLTALQGGSTGSSVTASYNYTRNLTVGDKGADVTALQQMLVAQGDLVMPSGVSYGYFGSLTKAALAKYQAANGITPAVGYFGPISRAYVAAHTSASTGSGSGSVSVPTGSGLAVSMASTNPMGMNIASGAVNQKMLSLNFTAGSQPVTVTSLQLVRGGLSQDSDLLNVYLYQNGNRLATNMGISNGVINFNASNGLFTVPAGQTVTIDVTADIANASNTGHVVTISLASAQGVTASQQVSGNFPITGNAMTISQVTLSALTFTNSSVGTSTLNAGQTNNLVGTFTLQAGSDPVKVTSIRFTETGSIPTQDIQNVRLLSGSTQVGGTIQSMNGNIAYFDLSNAPLMLAAGQTATLQLYADVTAGVGYYFQFTVQQSSDIQAVDTMYNVGIGATVAGSGTFPQSMTYVNVQNGGLVVTPASSSQIYVVAGNTNANLGSFNVLASGDNIRVQDVKVQFTATGTQMQNVQVLLNGAQIGTTQTNLGSLSGNVLDIPNLNYTISANTSVSLTVQGTVASTSISTVGVSVYIQGQQQSNYATVYSGGNSSNPAYVSAPSLQVLGTGTNLTAYANPSFGNPTYNAGTSPAKVASFVFQAGQVNSVSFAGITLQASTTSAGDMSNLYVQVAGQNYGSTYGSVTNGGSYAFNGTPVNVAPNTTLQVDVYATLGLNATENYPLVTLTGVNATAGSNSVTLASNVTGQTVTITPGAALQTSNVALDPNSMATTTLGMGNNGLTLGVFRLSATSTPITLTELDFVDASSSATASTSPAGGTFTNLQLVVAGQTTPLQTQPGFTNGTVKFTLASPLTIPQNGYVSLNLVGSIPAYNSYSMSEGTTHYIWLTNAVSQVASGASSTDVSGANVHTNGITVYKTTPTAFVGSNSLPSGVSPATTVSGGGYVGVFNVTAGAGGDVYVKSFTMQQSGNMVSSSGAINYSFYPYVNGSVQSAVATAAITGNNATTTVNFTSINAGGWDVPAGTTVPLLVKITNNPTTVTQSSNVAFTVAVTGGLTWNDGVSSTQAFTSVPSTLTFPQNSSVVSATN